MCAPSARSGCSGFWALLSARNGKQVPNGGWTPPLYPRSACIRRGSVGCGGQVPGFGIVAENAAASVYRNDRTGHKAGIGGQEVLNDGGYLLRAADATKRVQAPQLIVETLL